MCKWTIYLLKLEMYVVNDGCEITGVWLEDRVPMKFEDEGGPVNLGGTGGHQGKDGDGDWMS